MHRSYTDEQRAEAIALSLVVGPKAAAKSTGIPLRTICSWRPSSGKAAPPAAAVILDAAASNTQVVRRLWDVLTRAIDVLEAGLRDPEVRLGDVARATDVLLRSHNLLSGRATANVATNITSDLTLLDDDERRLIGNLTPEERHAYHDFMQFTVHASEALAAMPAERRTAMGLAIDAVWHDYLPDYDPAGIPWTTIPHPLGRPNWPGLTAPATSDPAALTETEMAQLEDWMRRKDNP